MGMKVGDFFVALGFEVDDKTLKAFNDQIKTGAKTLSAMGATAAATAYAINQFVASSVDSSVKLKNLSDQTGVATEEVQRFYNVAGRLNTEVNLDDVINAFGRLSDVIAEAKLGQGPIGEAAMLGLNNIGGMTPVEVIKQLRQNYKNNVAAWGNGDERVVQQLMKSIGLGPEFIQAIKATDEEYNKLWANPILDGQYREELIKLAQTQKEFTYQWELFKGNMSAKISPTVTDFLQSLNAILGKTSDLADQAAGKLKKVSEAVDKKDKTGAIKREARLAANAGVVGTGAALMATPSPFFVTQGIGATLILGAAINDLGRYIRGKDSTTGDLVNGFSVVRDNLKQDISNELMKTKEQQEIDRQDILKGKTGVFGRSPNDPTYGPQRTSAITNNNEFNIYSQGNPREVAEQVVSTLQDRQFRTDQINQLFQASGMTA